RRFWRFSSLCFCSMPWWRRCTKPPSNCTEPTLARLTMKITPLDIQHMVFKVSLRGYNRQDVDRFLEQIAQTVDELNREVAALREKLGSTEGQLTDSKKAETA